MTTIASSLGLSPMSYGAMQLTWKPNPPSDEQCFETIKTAIDAGCTTINSGEFYGSEHYGNTPTANLEMLSRFYAKYPEYIDRTKLSVKGAIQLDGSMKPNSSTDYLRQSVTNCNAKLGGKKKMDFFECARVDKSRPIEEVVKDLAALRDEGHFKHISLSEVNAETIRKAAKVADIGAVEVEYSFWTLDVEKNGVLDTCKELGIPLFAYSPLGKGFLTGTLKKSDLAPGDFRGMLDRFQDDAWEHNMKFVDRVKAFAAKKNISAAQLALAWLMHRGVIPLFGSTRASTVRDSVKALDIKLSDQDMKEIRELLNTLDVKGLRYNEHMEGSLAG